jgi:hypothetical protein
MADLEGREDIVAGAVAGALQNQICIRVGEGDLRVWNEGAAAVFYRTGDGPLVYLGEPSQRKQEQETKACQDTEGRHAANCVFHFFCISVDLLWGRIGIKSCWFGGVQPGQGRLLFIHCTASFRVLVGSRL